MEVKIYGTSDEVKDFLTNEIHKASFVTDCDERIYDCELNESHDSYLEITFLGIVVKTTKCGLIVQIGHFNEDKPCQLHVRTKEKQYYEKGELIRVNAKIVPKHLLQFGCELIADEIEELHC